MSSSSLSSAPTGHELRDLVDLLEECALEGLATTAPGSSPESSVVSGDLIEELESVGPAVQEVLAAIDENGENLMTTAEPLVDRPRREYS